MEFAPYEGKTTPDQILKQNVLKYLEFIKTASDEVYKLIATATNIAYFFF